jgi:sugar phosphate isomerase/epimerase
MLLENVKYFSSPERLKDVYNLGYELCFDVAHAQLLLGKEKLIETIVDMSPIIRYWHLADVRGEEHGFIVGQGVIDWCSISPFIRGHAVLEVRNEDELDPFEMAESLGYLRMMSVIDADVGMRRMLENEELQKILKKHNFELFDLL